MNAELIGVAVGLLCAGLGATIWRFEWIHLLSNVRAEEVDPSKKSDLARFAGRFMIGIGLLLVLLPFVIRNVQAEGEQLLAIFLVVVGIFAATGFYLKGLRQFLKK